MTYHITLVPRAEREARIKKSIDASHERKDFYDFRGTRTQLPQVRIPLDLPVYRMENFRTFSAQAEFLGREKKEASFFKAGQENETAQQVQHELLARLAAKGKARSVIPVVEVLQREGQREPLLITHRGVVVNGNRRLAAMRELFDHDSGAFHQFSHVDCLVLPADATAEDILEIEGVLQAKPETRLDYDWIGDAQLLAAMLKTKGTPEAVAKMLGRKVSEVKNALQALGEADLYLKDWASAEGHYSRVAEAGEQLFKDLPGQLQGKPAALQEASRAIAWTLFDNGDKLEGRLYNYNVAFGKRAEDVLQQLADDLGVPLSDDEKPESGDFDFDIEEDSGTISYRPLIATLRDQTRREEALDSLVAICDSVIEAEKDKKSGHAALKAISSANAKLAEVDLSRADHSTYQAIERQLESIIQRAQSLRSKMESYRKPVQAQVASDGHLG